MSRNIRGDESVLENVLSLVEALLQLSEKQDCESKLPLCAVWNADKLRITGYKSQQTRGNRSKTTEVGTKKEYLFNQIKDAGKTLKLPPQKAESNVSQEKRELDELQTALDWLKELGVREDQKSTKNQGYWKFTLTLKHQTATIKDNLQVVKQKWNEYQKTNLKETFQVQTTDSFDWQEICGAMLEKHKRLTTNELLFADDEMKFELEAIHVPLALVERNKPKKCTEDISAEQGSRLYEPSYEEKQRFEHEAFLEQIIRDGVGKTQGHRIALIGEPGAGKTTQLQTIAFWILKKNLGLPIWISLADLQEKSVENYLLQDWLKNALEVVRVKEEQENAIADLFKNNRVWLLLDAADEISSLQPLTEISQQLTGWVKNARVVLTCRVNVWEANANALENFETYRLLNFEYPQQVQEFIGRWFHNKDADKGEKLWQELDKAERQRIQDLVKNPLRLALLCSTWQGSDKGLPETKAGLYQHFVEEVYKWKENRFPTTEQQQEELNAALGRLAKRAIDQETSRFRLRHKFVREELGDAKQQNSLFWLALKLGWLNEVGLAAESATKEKVYAFYHPTFEEYFAALVVDDWHEFLNHVPDNPALGVYRIFAPQWKEVILLWLGREDMGREKKEEFIQALVKFDDGCGEYRAIDRVRKGFYEFRTYFLAAVGVDEWKNSVNTDAIVAEIVKWRCAEFKVEVNRWVEFLTPIAKGAETALSQTNRIKAIAALVELINKPQLDDSNRWQAAFSLGQIGSGDQKAIDALVELISKPKLDDNILRLAAFSLGQIGSGNQKAIDALVKLIGKTQLDYSTRWQAAERLGEIGSGNQKAIDALVELISKPQLDDDTRRLAAESLRQIGSGNQKAIDALVELIGKPQLNDDIRRLAAKSLRQIDSGNQKALAALVELINKPQLDDSTRWQAAFSLGQIDSGNQKAIDALVELIGKPQLDDSTRWQVAFSLGQIDSGNQKAIDALVELIGKPQLDDFTRWRAAYILGQIGSGNQKAIAALVELIGKPQLDDSTRSQVAESLWQIDPGNQEAIDALVELIGKPQLDYSTRRQAAYILGEIGSGNQEAIDALVKLIGKPQLDDSTRRQTAESLGKIGPSNQKTIAALVELIGKPQLDYFTRRQAAYILGQIGSGNQKAIAALLELIGNPQLDNDTRRQAAESLGQIGSGNQKAIAALLELIGNPQLDDDTRRQAAESLGKIMLEEQMPSVVTVLKDYLSPETYENDFKRFDNCYEVIWKCAQSMPYPAFYQAWHQQEKVKDGE
ncbi:HEAT repeat domain-containing protein [Nostoc edaphicum CCNP1411]|uniref:HEAT repeat domain-containing protein n=1 Tax=Nostoc edaphicum CCNP1411 TaxID=1472755 RepID=A0A7D7LG17_9NOSO|nr:HEAT repeat domain-containing protein [Nostoc edaphicum]QMS91054.1 HEAT repeat domain-containing protein [Nostoc edaphicum CCNP1411]